jgi:hypothetical protein
MLFCAPVTNRVAGVTVPVGVDVVDDTGVKSTTGCAATILSALDPSPGGCEPRTCGSGAPTLARGDVGVEADSGAGARVEGRAADGAYPRVDAGTIVRAGERVAVSMDLRVAARTKSDAALVGGVLSSGWCTDPGADVLAGVSLIPVPREFSSIPWFRLDSSKFSAKFSPVNSTVVLVSNGTL